MESSQTTIQEPLADVMELCTIMQCLGFSVKSLETSGIDSSQEAGVTTVVINCQSGSSGLHVVMESGNANFTTDVHNQIDKETGSTLLRSLPNVCREHVASKLRAILQLIKKDNESEGPFSDLTTAETSSLQVNMISPSQYTSTSAMEVNVLLPAPGVLQKPAEEDAEKKKGSRKCRRANTYIISSFPAIVPRSHNKTSPNQDLPSSSMLASPIAAEEKAEDLREQLSMAGKLKSASSPNLSGVASTKECSTLSNPKKMGQKKEGKIAKLKQCLYAKVPIDKKKSTGVKDKTQDGKN